jgi:general secretion pathway protein N
MSQSTIKIGRWIFLGVSLFFIFTITRVPAEWGAWLLTRQPGLALSGITGSMWKGQANVASLSIEGQQITLGKLTWDLQLLSLLKLSPCVKLVVSGQAQSFNGTVCSSLTGLISIKDADINLPAKLVQSRIPIPIEGQFSIHLNQLRLKGNVLFDLAGNLNWSNAQANNDIQWIPLGSFAAKFTDNDRNGIKAKIFDLDSEIDLAVDLELLAPAGGSAQGKVALPQQFIDRYRLADFLAFVGPQSGEENGKVVYQVQQEF